MGALGNTPYIYRGAQEDQNRLFYSDQNKAVLLPISIPAGCGLIKAGAVMAKISESTNRLGYYTPYTGETPSAGLTTLWGAAYVTANGADSTSVSVLMEDSYKFAIGDHLAAVDSDGSPEDLGAITAIDRTTYTHIAVITVSSNLSSSITIAAGGCVFIQTKTTSPYTYAKGILLASVDTGTGTNAKGGDGVLVAGNATLYKDMLWNYDSEALTDLSYAREEGKYLIMT